MSFKVDISGFARLCGSMTNPIYVIPDIHGQIAMLDEALLRIEGDGGADAQIVFLGDYVDRGPDSRGVIDRLAAGQAEGRDWITGTYSIADIAIVPWLQTITKFYDAASLVELDTRKNVQAYIDRFAARPAVEKGWGVPA